MFQLDRDGLWSYLLVSALTLCAISLASAQTSISETQVRDLQNKYDHAVESGDRATLETILADDFSIVHGNGRAQDRAGFVGTSRTGLNMKLETSPQAKVILLKDTAIISGPTQFSIKTPDGTVRMQQELVTGVWVQRGGSWKLLMIHATNVMPTPPAQPRANPGPPGVVTGER